MKVLLELTDLIKDKGENIKSAKIVEDGGRYFFDFKFNPKLTKEEKIKLAKCLGDSLVKNTQVTELFKSGFGIRF